MVGIIFTSNSWKTIYIAIFIRQAKSQNVGSEHLKKSDHLPQYNWGTFALKHMLRCSYCSNVWISWACQSLCCWWYPCEKFVTDKRQSEKCLLVHSHLRTSQLQLIIIPYLADNHEFAVTSLLPRRFVAFLYFITPLRLICNCLGIASQQVHCSLTAVSVHYRAASS